MKHLIVYLHIDLFKHMTGSTSRDNDRGRHDRHDGRNEGSEPMDVGIRCERCRNIRHEILDRIHDRRTDGRTGGRRISSNEFGLNESGCVNPAGPSLDYIIDTVIEALEQEDPRPPPVQPSAPPIEEPTRSGLEPPQNIETLFELSPSYNQLFGSSHV